MKLPVPNFFPANYYLFVCTFHRSIYFFRTFSLLRLLSLQGIYLIIELTMASGFEADSLANPELIMVSSLETDAPANLELIIVFSL